MLKCLGWLMCQVQLHSKVCYDCGLKPPVVAVAQGVKVVALLGKVMSMSTTAAVAELSGTL